MGTVMQVSLLHQKMLGKIKLLNTIIGQYSPVTHMYWYHRFVTYMACWIVGWSQEKKGEACVGLVVLRGMCGWCRHASHSWSVKSLVKPKEMVNSKKATYTAICMHVTHVKGGRWARVQSCECHYCMLYIKKISRKKNSSKRFCWEVFTHCMHLLNLWSHQVHGLSELPMGMVVGSGLGQGWMMQWELDSVAWRERNFFTLIQYSGVGRINFG